MGLRISQAQEICGWLLRTPHVSDGGRTLVRELAEVLRSHGLPLWRMSVALLTKHPEVVWSTLQWHETEGVRVIERQHQVARQAYFTDSPVAQLLEGSPPVRVRLGAGSLPFPICRDLRDQGATDYYAQRLAFSNGQISYVSWTTRDAAGFDDESLATLDAIAPSLARHVELESAYHATRSLLDIYLGRNAANRVLAGAFKRGAGELIPAAIWFCDLRDFTPLSDRLAPKAVVELLDAHFDGVAGAVTARGGEVLKFIGDAILAIFPVADDAPSACRSAFMAAEDALAAVGELNGRRVDSPLAMGIGLHLGEVMYGNIGSKERLDFTVISASVNETCRLESLCKVLGTPLTMSKAFVAAWGGPGVVDLGEHALKGVSQKVRVFTHERHAPR